MSATRAEGLQLAPSAARRVDRTLAVGELCEFDAFGLAYGDTAASIALAEARSIMRAATEGHAVRVTRWRGASAMFSCPDAGRLLHCMVDVRGSLREGAPPLRAGVARGPVVLFEGDDYVGAAANHAARLCRSARPGEILVTADLLADLPSLEVTAAA